MLVARLLLATVFLVAGAGKLGDPPGSIQAFRDFGVPRRLAAILALLLAAGEIAVAIALIPVALARYGACAALALFSIFIVAIGVALARGRNPDCHCFGQLSSTPIGWKTLVRNGILGAAPDGWFTGGRRDWVRLCGNTWRRRAATKRKIFIVAGCLVCFLIFRALTVKKPADAEDSVVEPQSEMRSNSQERTGESAEPSPRRHNPELEKVLQIGSGWPIGTRAPEFDLSTLDGQTCSLASLREEGKMICVVFSNPYCEPCRALWPHLSRWRQEHEQSLSMVVVSRGSAKDHLAKLNDFPASRVLLQNQFACSESYGVTSTPAAVLVGADGLIQSQLAVGRADIRRLMSLVVGPTAAATPTGIEPQPDVLT